MRRIGWPLVLVLLLAVGGGYGLYTQTRIAALEAEVRAATAANSSSEARQLELEGRLTKAETDLRSRPAVGDLTVVARELKAASTELIEGCVRYRAFDKVEQKCVLAPTSPTGVPGANFNQLMACYLEAQVGSPLPRSCR